MGDASGLYPRPTGGMLHSEVRSYCARVRCSLHAFSLASGVSDQTLRSIELAERPLPRTVARVRHFIAANPDRCPSPTKHSATSGTSALPTRGPARVLSRAGRAGLSIARADSIAPARPSLAAVIAAEAEDAARRRGAARMGSPRKLVPHALGDDATVAELLSTAVVETPGDLIARVRDAWPDLWAGIRDQARAHHLPPGAMLMQVIERGLEEFSA